MAYFQYLPKLRYPSLSQKGDDYEYQTVTNLFRRAKIRDDIFNESTLFTKYSINGDDRPDNVAFEVYGDSDLDWVVLVSNNIINIRDEWPMSQSSFDNYIKEKYPTVAERNAIKHYVTTEVKDSKGRLIRPSGIIVSTEDYANYTFEYFSNGSITTLTSSSLDSVSMESYEYELNEEKRNIFLVKPELISTVISDLERIMEYDDSSQYVTDDIKKTSI